MQIKIEYKNDEWIINDNLIATYEPQRLDYWRTSFNRSAISLYFNRRFTYGIGERIVSIMLTPDGHFTTRIIEKDSDGVQKILSEKHKEIPVPVKGNLNIIFKDDVVSSFAYFTDDEYANKLTTMGINKINSFPNKKDDGRFIIQNNKWEIFSNYTDTPNSISFKAPLDTKVRINFDVIEVEYPKDIKPIERWIIIKENDKSVMYLNHGKLTDDIINAVNNVEFINLN